MPKIESLKTDIIERGIDIAFLQEIWENEKKESHSLKVENMFELLGLHYYSNPRPLTKKGYAYGGAAIIVNGSKFTSRKLNEITPPEGLEVVWGLAKSKSPGTKFKSIILCSFYSPPGKGKNTRLADHLVTTLHSLYTKYPDSGIILGADKNGMDLTPLLNCGLHLRQVVDKCTHGRKIIDVLIMNLFAYYQSPEIAPPVKCDDPKDGVPSDHFVPVCSPHTNRFTRPPRNYRVIQFRPLSESNIRKFGQWITHESWLDLKNENSSTSQALELEKLLLEKLNSFCPLKTLKLSSYDKPFITHELKKLDRQRSREYQKHGKSQKYFDLKKQFENKYKKAAKVYLDKSLNMLHESKPGQAFRILKKLGAHPGDCTDNSGSFTLTSHENISPEISTEKIADHFAAISQEFPPLLSELLPRCVREKLNSPGNPPQFSEYEVYCKIRQAKKPNSGTPHDIPKKLVVEFAPELTIPVTKIVNTIFQTGEWPTHWKQEYVVPIAKRESPETEDDIRPISLTPFFSKVSEHFVVEWLLKYISNSIDFRQYGGIKGNSITHYLVEFINFILTAQDSPAQTAVLACYVDFQKAFNRQNHFILIKKLSDLNVPGWLLKIIISFLQDRSMSVRFKGYQSSVKSLPGGSPQGTLLALLLFLVMINDTGFEGQTSNVSDIITSMKKIRAANHIHLKFVDDLTLAGLVNLKDDLVEIPECEREHPTTYHERTGHFLPDEKNIVYKQLIKTQEFASDNEMRVNFEKTKVMLFNPCTSLDFDPSMEVGGIPVQQVKETKLLGLLVSDDLKWLPNTEYLVKKAYRRLWILRRLKILGAKTDSLCEVYTKQIRCVLELGVPVWNGSLTKKECYLLERVQKSAFHIILGQSYLSYDNALIQLNMESLEQRRYDISLTFALKSERSPKFSLWFKPNPKFGKTRTAQPKYQPTWNNHARLEKSPISYLTTILNAYYGYTSH